MGFKMGEASALEKLFFRKLQLFTRQNVEMILHYGTSPIPITWDQNGETNYIVDNEHKFWKDYPEYRWFGGIIAECFAACLNIEQLTKESLSAAFGQFEQEVEHSVGSNLRTFFGGLDFSLITAISCEKYEKNVGNGLCAAIIPSNIEDLDLEACNFSRFNGIKCDSLEYRNVHGLRKLLNMTSAPDSCLVFAKKGGKYHALGLASRKKCTKSFPHILFTGHAEWELHFPCASGYNKGCRIKYSVGKFMLPVVNTSRGEKKLIKRLLPSVDTGHIGRIGKLISKLKKIGSGAIVIIGENDFIGSEVRRLCKNAELGIAFSDGGNGGNNINCSDDLEGLRQLTAIDGAIFVNYKTECHAFGVILDGTVNPDEQSPELMGNISRGSRFNSANNYVNANLGADRGQKGKLIGLVTSDDGMFDILPERGAKSPTKDDDSLLSELLDDIKLNQMKRDEIRLKSSLHLVQKIY